MILLITGLMSNVHSQVEYEDDYENCPCPENVECNYDENSNDCKCEVMYFHLRELTCELTSS